MVGCGLLQPVRHQQRKLILLGNGRDQPTIRRTQLPDRTANQRPHPERIVTTGPATACEATDSDTPVYIVSYNESMANVAPTTYLTGCKSNWEPYVTGAVESVLKDIKIEENVKGNVVGNDMGAGFEEGWVEMLELNELVAAKGTKAKMQEVINGFKIGRAHV